jgi:O-antigen ligase
MFRIICKDEKYATGITPCMTHPHNFYIQLLAETGIIGFLFLFSALSYVFIQL